MPAALPARERTHTMMKQARNGALALAAMLCCAVAFATEVKLFMMEVPPFTVNEPTRKGIVGDIVLEAIRRAGHTAQLIVVPSARAMSLVESEQSEDQFLMPLARQPAREAHYSWIAPVIKINRAFFSLDRKVRSFDEARASFRHIAVARGTAGVNILHDHGFSDTQIYRVSDTIAGAKMLMLGRVDAWYGPELQFRSWQHEADPTERAQASALLGTTDNYLVCSLRCDPPLQAQLADAIAKMRKDGSIKAIEARYGIRAP